VRSLLIGFWELVHEKGLSKKNLLVKTPFHRLCMEVCTLRVMGSWHESFSQYHHGLTDQIYNIIDWQTLFTWLWRWLPLNLNLSSISQFQYIVKPPISNHLGRLHGRHGGSMAGLMVTALVSESSVLGLSPGWGTLCCVLGQGTGLSQCSLHPGV